MKNIKKIEWVILIGLVLLSLIPSVGGIFRLVELGIGSGILPDNPRVKSEPIPVAFHIVSSVIFCILGIFQFLPSFRKMYPIWHRLVGRLLVGAGTISAFSGLWMTHYYAFSTDLQGDLLYSVRIVVGFAMFASILSGLAAVLSKRFVHHQAWMIRAYALGQGAGTQVLITIPMALTMGQPSGFSRELMMTLGWVINVVAAEVIIRKQSHSGGGEFAKPTLAR